MVVESESLFMFQAFESAEISEYFLSPFYISPFYI